MARTIVLGLMVSVAFAIGANPAPARAQAWPELVLMPLPHQFATVTELANAGDGSGRLYVVEKRGTIRLLEANGSLAVGFFLDIRNLVGDGGSEQGLLGLAFSPAFATDRTFYVNYTDHNGDTVAAKYRALSSTDADETSAEEVLFVDQPAANHNGGHLVFGPDGWLYIGMGDGGGSGDQQNRAQNDADRLGKMLRYNPANGTTETWAKGLRNPWKFSFDRATGDLYIADVGQNAWEEVNFVPGGSGPGLNFGWRRMEGLHCFPANSTCDSAGLVLPVTEYSHDEGCSVTGGYVSRKPGDALEGIYVFGDYCSGTIWGLRRDENGRWERETLGATPGNITTFGEGEDGTLYLVDANGPTSSLVKISDAGRAPGPLPVLNFRTTVVQISADR